MQAKGAAACKLPPGVSLEAIEADVQLAQVREATRGIVEALRGVAADHPELNLLQRVECEARVKLPAADARRPGSAASTAATRSLCSTPSGRCSPGSSRPGTGGATAGRSPSRPSAGSVWSEAAAAVRRSPAAAKSPAVQTVTLQL